MSDGDAWSDGKICVGKSILGGSLRYKGLRNLVKEAATPRVSARVSSLL